MKAKEILIIFLLLSTFVFSACTGNPFSDDEISLETRRITGKVEIKHNQSPEGVYVWLEGFDIGTFTNQDGEFEITLPSTAQNSGGAAGILDLYYYLENYKLTTTELTVRSGEFVFTTGGEINNKGELHRPKFIQRILDISTELTPSTANADSSIFMKVEVVLSSETNSVTVFYPRETFNGPNKLLMPLFVKNLETGTAFYVEATPVGFFQEDLITIDRGSSFVRTMLFKGILSEGQYEIIPYLRVLQPDVPAELLNNLIEDIDSFGLDYLNVPFLRTGGVLSVVNGGGGEGGR